MKKVFLLIAMLLLACPVNAANWVEIGYKNYIDASSINRETKYYDRNGSYNPHYQVSAWIKSLNPGDWEKFENKKIWYEQNFVAANCLNKQIDIQSKHIYDLNGNVLYSKQYLHEWLDVVPDSLGESWFNAMCVSPAYFTSKYINKEDWRAIQEEAFINLNSIEWDKNIKTFDVTVKIIKTSKNTSFFKSYSKKAKNAILKYKFDTQNGTYYITSALFYDANNNIVYKYIPTADIRPDFLQKDTFASKIVEYIYNILEKEVKTQN